MVALISMLRKRNLHFELNTEKMRIGENALKERRRTSL